MPTPKKLYCIAAAFYLVASGVWTAGSHKLQLYLLKLQCTVSTPAFLFILGKRIMTAALKEMQTTVRAGR